MPLGLTLPHILLLNCHRPRSPYMCALWFSPEALVPWGHFMAPGFGLVMVMGGVHLAGVGEPGWGAYLAG